MWVMESFMEITKEQLKAVRDQLLAKGVHAGLIDPVIDASGAWQVHLSWKDAWAMDAVAMKEFLLESLKPIHMLQQASLDFVNLTGFNDHGPIHITNVTNKTLDILKSLKFEEEILKIAVMAATTHDLGNIINRKGHSMFSCGLIRMTFTDLPDNQQAADVLQAVLFHDEGALGRNTKLEEWVPAALALVIADKTDISYLRVTSSSNKRDALVDAHISLNWLVDESKTFMSMGTYVWQIYFNPGASNVPSYMDQLMKNEQRKWVPEVWQELYRQRHMEYLLPFYATLQDTYLHRVEMTVKAVFVLFPEVNVFRFEVIDEERLMTISRLFTRQDVEKQFDRLKRMVYKNLEQTTVHH